MRKLLFSIIVAAGFSLTPNKVIAQVASGVPQTTDTIYIGIVNKINLGGDTTGFQRAESAQAKVEVSAGTLFISPRQQGLVNVTLHYSRGVVNRSFYSTYLPDPKQKQR